MAQQTLTDKDVDDLLQYYLAKPQYYVTDVLGSKPWAKQIEIVESVFKYKYTAVKTCNAIGKSYIAARIVITYLMLHPGSIVVTTAPTWRQVTDVLWREIGTALKMSKYKLTEAEATKSGLDISSDWYAVGLSTSRPENFFGYHADHILVVVDEAGGVDEPIFKGVAAITPNINSRVLLIGNPTEPSGTFYDAFNKPALGYNCITVSAFDTPNFIDTGIRTLEDLITLFTPPDGIEQSDWTQMVNEKLLPKMDPTYAGLIAPSVVYGRYHEWGIDSAPWESLIMGEFPSQAEQSLLPANLVRMAMNMYGTDETTGQSYAELSGWTIPDGPPHYGQDMARFGNDLNVNTPTHGGWVEKQIVWNKKGDAKKDLVESAEMILNIIDPLDRDTVVSIDDTGNGGGTTDHMRYKDRESQNGGRPAHQYTLVPYVFGSKEMMTDVEKEKFADITSMLYWNLRQWFYTKQIALHFDQQLYDELVSRRWGLTKDGKIKVESKEEYKKRTGGKSPDRSDSLVLAFARKKPMAVEQPADKPTQAQIDAAEKLRQSAARDMAPLTSGLDQRY